MVPTMRRALLRAPRLLHPAPPRVDAQAAMMRDERCILVDASDVPLGRSVTKGEAHRAGGECLREGGPPHRAFRECLKIF